MRISWRFGMILKQLAKISRKILVRTNQCGMTCVMHRSIMSSSLSTLVSFLAVITVFGSDNAQPGLYHETCGNRNVNSGSNLKLTFSFIYLSVISLIAYFTKMNICSGDLRHDEELGVCQRTVHMSRQLRSWWGVWVQVGISWIQSEMRSGQNIYE